MSFFPYASLAEMAIVNAAAAFGQPVQTLTDLLWTESMNGMTDIRELMITLTPERDFARFDIYANTKNENKVRLAREMRILLSLKAVCFLKRLILLKSNQK